MTSTTAAVLRQETASTASARSVDMISGRDTTLMTSIAKDAAPGRADMLSGARTCMMTSIADL